MCNNPKEDGSAASERKSTSKLSTTETISNETSFPIPENSTLVELIGRHDYYVEKLLVSKENSEEVVKIYVDEVPVEIEFLRNGNDYTVSSPHATNLNGARMSELVAMTAPAGMFALPDNMRLVAVSYANLLRGTKVGAAELGDAAMFMTYLSQLADAIRGVSDTNPTIITMGGVPIVKYSEKDFARIIMLSVLLSSMMSGGKVHGTRCKAGRNIACFEAVFEPDIPSELMTLLSCGQFDEYPFNGEYGGIFMTACYLRHLSREYGYSFTVEQNDDAAVLTMAFPLVKTVEPAVTLMEIRDKAWIEKFAKVILG